MPSKTSPKPGKQLQPDLLQLVLLNRSVDALDNYSQDSSRLAKSLDLVVGELEDHVVQLGTWSAESLVKNLADRNPDLPLDDRFQYLPPFELLKALLRVALPDVEI